MSRTAFPTRERSPLYCDPLIRYVFSDLFKVDPQFLENEERYADIKREILGDSDDEESGSENEFSDEDEEDDVAPEKAGIMDMTETNLINLRRTIYLTIMNSVSASGFFSPAAYELTFRPAQL